MGECLHSGARQPQIAQCRILETGSGGHHTPRVGDLEVEGQRGAVIRSTRH